jgi:hypothetical protein
MRLAVLSFFILLLLPACQDDTEDHDASAACRYCILEKRVEEAQITFFVSKIKNKSYQDSLEIILDSLYLVKHELLDSFSGAYNLHKFSTEDSIHSWCYDSRPYGEGINPEKSKRMMWWLGNEIILMNSGQVLGNEKYLSSDQYVDDFVNKESGDTVSLSKGISGEDMLIVNFPKWRKQQLAEWNEWMKKVNLYLKEMTSKSFPEMSQSEVLFLKFKLEMFMDGKKSSQ